MFSPFYNRMCCHRKSRFNSQVPLSIVLFAIVLFIQSSPLSAQSKSNVEQEKEAAKIQQKLERGIERSQSRSKSVLPNQSLRNFTRGGMHTGNLIQVPYVTNINISAGYWGGFVSPSRITWPKGSGVEYGHTMSFIVGGKVIADDGNEYVILSDSYNRSGGDSSPDGSHKYHFTPIPGYYNMYGSRSSSNRLNDNPDDRQRLEDAGYYFVGGLNEDVNGNGTLDDGEDLNNNGQLNVILENRAEYTSQSNLPETWPAFWPPQSYPGDDRQENDIRPGVREGRWNGAYGAYVRADQESYYLADDRDNDEFPYAPFLDPSTGEPDLRSWANGGRRGLGVEVSTRQYQWASVLAEDIFITTFDVKNVSRKDIPESIIGMIVDYDIGGETGANNALFDTKDDITYQWSKRNLVRNGFNVGYAGVGFLESPGNEVDGVDNDEDGMTDESREDGIDNDGDWRAWEDVNLNGVYDNEDLNNNFKLDPGEDVNGNGILDIEPINDDTGSDGLGPENENYPGPDADGTEANGVPDPGEPNFEFTDNDEIDQIGLTNMVIRTPSNFDEDLDDDELFWNDYIQPVPESEFIIPTETADIIYAYSSGIVEIKKESAQRFSIAFFCGNDFDDMLRNKRTMQNIYDSDYNFSKPPRRPFLTAVPSDGKVTLVWDESAESSRDPIYGFDFEMYKVYKSTDPEFNDIKTISDAFGNPLLWEPLVQFDLDNGLAGAHPIQVGNFGVSYDMGTDSGLEYSYIDTDVDNGRTYYYAVVSVDQGYATSFYDEGISVFENLAEISPTESSKIIEVDAFERPVFIDRNTAVVTPQPRAAGYVEADLVNGLETISGNSTGNIKVDFLLPDSANAQNYTYEFSFTDDNSFFEKDSIYLEYGVTTGFSLTNVTTGEVVIESDPTASGEAIFDTPLLNARVYDGMKFTIQNPIEAQVKELGWSKGAPRMTTVVDADGASNNNVPRDYEIRISEIGTDTSKSINANNRIPTNFQIWDITNPNTAFKVPFSFKENRQLPQDTVRGMLSPGDEINIKIAGVDVPGLGRIYTESTWRFTTSLSTASSSILQSIQDDLNLLYDSLRAYQVRSTQTLPYGSDLSGRQYIDFVDYLMPWYDSVRDSLLSESGVNTTVAQVGDLATIKNNLDAVYNLEMPNSGDVFYMLTDKPFNRSDRVRFSVDGNYVQNDLNESVLDSIHVAPDPYIAVNSLEARNTTLPGRGAREIRFRMLPQEATISIFTMSGRLVKTLYHSSNEFGSFKTWDLKSEDGLDVAFGVYIYHVNAPGIGEKVGRFALIK